MTQRLPTAVARKDFANVLRDSAAGKRIKLTRYNKTVGVIISKKDFTDLEECQKLHGVHGSAEQPSTAPTTRPRDSKAHKKSEP